MTPKRKINKKKSSSRTTNTYKRGMFVVTSKVETIALPLKIARTFINKVVKIGGRVTVTKVSTSKVSVVAKMTSVPLSATKAETLAKQSRASGATVTVRKQ